jgi:VWFA-related protein
MTIVLRVSLLLLCFAILSSGASSASAQSGRRQKTENKESKPVATPRPIADPNFPGSSSTATPTPVSTDRPRSAAKKPEEIDPNDVVKISSNLVPIPASVVDARGNAVVNLKLEDFELQVDGQPRAISELSRSETSVRMAMLFDNSGSLDTAREFEKRAAVRFFRRVMRPIDEAAIYSVATDSYLAQPLTKNVGLLEQTILGFGRPEGGTSLLDAIVDSGRYLRPYAGRRVIVIVSDGIETTSRNDDFELAVQKVLSDDCQIFVVQTGMYESANVRPLVAERRMQQITEQTGGAVYIPKTTSDLDVAFDQIAADLAQQYVLSYYPSSERQDGRVHVLEVKVKSRNDVRVRSRRGYFAPKSASSAEW